MLKVLTLFVKTVFKCWKPFAKGNQYVTEYAVYIVDQKFQFVANHSMKTREWQQNFKIQ